MAAGLVLCRTPSICASPLRGAYTRSAFPDPHPTGPACGRNDGTPAARSYSRSGASHTNRYLLSLVNGGGDPPDFVMPGKGCMGKFVNQPLLQKCNIVVTFPATSSCAQNKNRRNIHGFWHLLCDCNISGFVYLIH